MEVILASQSPRRKELLHQLIDTFQIIPADIDETPCQGENPIKYVQRMAMEKAEVIAQTHRKDLVIASDTTVVANNQILGKPESEEDARTVLHALSDRTHEVYTAVVLQKESKKEVAIAQATVTFYPLTDEEIDTYLASGEYMDKAGSYGIQGKAGKFVKTISGDYYSIVGFPVGVVNQMLKKF
ncbi:MAG: Maf family protein [Enterococcus sp.]